MTFQIKVFHQPDSQQTIKKHDLQSIVLISYQKQQKKLKTQTRDNIQDIIVRLKLSLMKTFFEKKGYLDLNYISSVIKQVINNFKIKNKLKELKPEWTNALIKQCEAEVDMMARVETEERTELDISEDDIDNWFAQGL